MKLGSQEIVFTPRPPAGHKPALVEVTLRYFGAKLGEAAMTPTDARTMAAEILSAANVAEGRG